MFGEARTSSQRTTRRLMLIVLTATVVVVAVGMAGVTARYVTPLERGPLGPWTIHLGKMDEAVAADRLGVAESAWHDAYRAALGSRRWEGMVEVGDASRRLGEVVGSRQASEVMPRRLYLAALFQARQEGSLDGVIRTAEAFSSLGDRAVVVQCLRVAERLAVLRGDAQARERVATLRARLARS